MEMDNKQTLNDYYPGFWDDWTHKTPDEVGMNGKLLEEAIAFTTIPEHESSRPRDLGPFLATIRARNYHDDGIILGPTKSHGAVNGLIVKNGYIVAEWGETNRVDMTFSVTKSFLSIIAGLALDRGLIRNIHDKVQEYVTDGKFDSPHNSKITWHHLLQQTNEWIGTLWDKHFLAGTDRVKMREPEEPGTHFEYNDLRVNLTAYSLLNVWRKPLPQVLKDEIMDPICASNTWRWHGYRNSWVNIDGVQMQSVSGGGHWGGGMHISSRDLAHFGYLILHRGKWKNQQLISEKWIELMTSPCNLNPSYGYMWWLNTDRKRLPKAPETCLSATGAGGNRIFIDSEHDLIIVVRWLGREYFKDFLNQVLATMN